MWGSFSLIRSFGSSAKFRIAFLGIYHEKKNSLQNVFLTFLHSYLLLAFIKLFMKMVFAFWKSENLQLKMKVNTLVKRPMMLVGRSRSASCKLSVSLLFRFQRKSSILIYSRRIFSKIWEENFIVSLEMLKLSN